VNSVVVFGAAGAIGVHAVAEFQNAGFSVVGVDLNTFDESVNAGNLSSEMATIPNVDYRHIVADATRLDDVAAVFSELSSVTHVVTTVGGAFAGEVANNNDITKVSVETIKNTVNRNLLSCLHIARYALPLLREQSGDASYTMTGSINGTRALGLASYSASKAGLVSLAQNLAAQEGPHGVRVNVLSPGTVVTPRTARLWSGDEDHFEVLRATTFLGRTASLPEVGAAFKMLAVDLTAVTGTVLNVDCGQGAHW